ncbi:MAG: crossover junction endodeoxyribonuclease RuvC [Armatimonadetes bacterium]|nr:crossover junction endodeoxyribonuclease RuvC [Armatimonadota bacterium]
MTILGVDPGTATTGYGIVNKQGATLTAVAFGVIRTSPRHQPPERLAQVHDAIGELMDQYGVEALATERLFFSKNETTAFGVGRTIGVVLLAASRRAIPWCEYSPVAVKQAVVGYGAADKRQVQYMMQRILGLDGPPTGDDAADALAVAVCHAHMLKAEG